MLFFAAFWVAHLVRRWRGIDDDPVLLPIVLMLSGIGLMSMVALRDPLRDTVTRLSASRSASRRRRGAGRGLVRSISRHRGSVARWRCRSALALGLAALLLVFGSGPGTSGVKVNLLGVQPVEAIRLLVVFALAAYFARRLEFLRELSEPATPARPWLRYVHAPRWKDVRPVVVSMSLVLLFFFLQKDLGPALVLSFVFLGLYGIARGRVAVRHGRVRRCCSPRSPWRTGSDSRRRSRQRVAIWIDPWNNGVAGGNQIAHGLWALATGAIVGRRSRPRRVLS